MAPKAPLNPAVMRKVYISEARCNSRLLHTSKRYRLHFIIQSPATVTGLRSPKSDYIQAIHNTVMWKDPFGDEFMTPTDCIASVDLIERHLGRSGRIVASWTFDLSSATDKEIRPDLKGSANSKFGELTMCVASSPASTSDAVESAYQATGQLGPGLAAVDQVIQATAPLAPEITTQLDAWQSLLSRLGALVKVADMVAEVHPWIKLAWGVVSAAYKIASVQSDRDAKVMGLVQIMADSCSFADEAKELKKRSETDQVIINQILRQVMECTYFIREYCRDKSFAKRTVKYTVSLVDAWIDNYKGTLDTLRRNLIDHANIQCAVITHRVLDVVTEVRDLQVLSELKYAPEAHHDLDQGCLAGTRTEIIDAIVCWALGADIPPSDRSIPMTPTPGKSSRVLWLCGTAGAGKSSILRSCAQRISLLERKGSYYGFDKNQPLANLTNLFSTIARDLADLDNSRKQRLVDAVKNNTAIRTTVDCKLQFQHFIIASFKGDNAQGETVVFIDAFDESGDVRTRANVLSILTKQASELPPGLRVIVTSRYELDIQHALRFPLPRGVDVMLVDDIPTYQTSRDIAAYVHNELREMDELQEAAYQTQLSELIRRAGTSFQWAATACRFICSIDVGVDPRERIGTVLGADEGLYPLYATVMKEHCNPSDKAAVKRVKSILGRIICAREPLSLHALLHLFPPNSIRTSDRIQQHIIKGLASVLSGTHNEHELIVPLHGSYRDFLCSAEHNKDFYIDETEANLHMALACFRVMEQNLKFNICQLPTSFFPNVDIPEIPSLCEKHIPYHLSYACRFWCLHMSAMPSGEVIQKHMESFFQKDFLHWLEVMSLTQSSPQRALASLSTSHMAAELVELQNDAMQFISMFATAIMTSTPHIYLSGLTFAPTSSLLYQRQQGQFPGVAKLIQGQLQHWPKVVLILEGHYDAVTCVAFSPDGKQIASGSKDETIRLWNAETGVSIGQPIMGYNQGILSIAFSPDGKKIASGSCNGTIQLWNVETGVGIGQPMKGHTQDIESIAFSHDGKKIASGSWNGTVQLWDVETGANIGQPIKGRNQSVCIAFSPDGKQIAGGHGKSIQLQNLEIGAPSSQWMKGHDDFIEPTASTTSIASIAFSPDGKLIVCSNKENIQLWNAETGMAIGQAMDGHGWIQSVAFSPDGKQIALGSIGGGIQLWSVETGLAIGQQMREHDGAILSVSFSPDGKQIASGSSDKTIRLWNVEMGMTIGQPKKTHAHDIWSVAFSPDGKWMASCSSIKSIQLWDVGTGASIGQPMEEHQHGISSIAFSLDSKQIASGGPDKVIQLWNVETGIASVSWDRAIQLCNAETGVSIDRPMRGHDDTISSIALSPNGKEIASGSQGGTIQVWDMETGVSIGKPMEGHNQSIRSIAFSPNGKQIASSSWDKTIQLWNTETGVRIGQPMEWHGYLPPPIAFSPDGKKIVSGSSDKTIHLWNAETRADIGQLIGGHADGIWSIHFLPDGSQIASRFTQLTAAISWLSPGKSKHSLQYPPHLFPLPPSSFQLDDGWILGPNDELILWVPPAYRKSLEHPHCQIIGKPNNTQIDFQHLKCGKDWAQCQEQLDQ